MTMVLNGSWRATRLILSTHAQFPRPLSHRYKVLGTTAPICRSYATTRNPKHVKANGPKPKDKEKEEEDKINGPRSTLPPPLQLPERAKSAAIVHLFRIGRAYAKFYWAGLKATWSNHKNSRRLKNHMAKTLLDKGHPPIWHKKKRQIMYLCEVYTAKGGLPHLSRSDLQLMVREHHDFMILPPFALMVALFGEWLPLIVPFIPGLVPRTCRIPSQIDSMRKRVEERRKLSFRQGLKVPHLTPELSKPVELPKIPGVTHLTANSHAMALTKYFQQPGKKAEMVHLSRSLNLGGRVWDHYGLRHPFLSSRLIGHLHYLALDDRFLLRDWVMSHLVLTEEETRIACEERGIDVLGRSQNEMKKDLGKWLEKRKRDKTYGVEITNMLFTRPNTWK